MPRPLARGCDTFWGFWRAPIAGQVLEDLLLLRDSAKGLPEPQWPRVHYGGQELVLRPHGGGGADILMLNDAFAFKLSSTPLPGMPAIQVEIRSIWLWQKGLEAFADAQRVLEDLVPDAVTLHPAALKLEVSQYHLCVDFQGWPPDEQEIKPPWCGKRPGQTIDKNAPGLKSRCSKFEPHYDKRRGCTGGTYGTKTAEIQAGLYNKTIEIADASNKTWFEEVWKQSADYVEGEDVWRLEFRLKREAITGFQIIDSNGKGRSVSTFDDFMEALPNIWRYLTGRWLCFRSERTKTTRQVIEPWWLTFHDLDWDLMHKGCPAVLRKRIDKIAYDTLAQLRGIIANELACSQHHSRNAKLTLDDIWANIEHKVKALDLERSKNDPNDTIAAKAATKRMGWGMLMPDHWAGATEPTGLPESSELAELVRRARDAVGRRYLSTEARVDLLKVPIVETEKDPDYKRRKMVDAHGRTQ
jgi:hypothetical protein